ncbi:NTP transferase domain-containing protein [Megalodesulfovibrio paquesii]
MTSFPCILPAAGLGSRLAPLLAPGLMAMAPFKELLPVAGRPVILHALAQAAAAGADTIAVVLRPGKELLKDLIDQEKAALAPGCEVVYRWQDFSQGPLGEGHAILQCRDVVDGAPCFGVLYPDNLYLPPADPAPGQTVADTRPPADPTPGLAGADTRPPADPTPGLAGADTRPPADPTPGLAGADTRPPLAILRAIACRSQNGTGQCTDTLALHRPEQQELAGYANSGRLDLAPHPDCIPDLRQITRVYEKGPGTFMPRRPGEARACGLSVATPRFLDALAHCHRALPPGQERTDGHGRRRMLADGLPLLAFQLPGRVYDMGTPEGYALTCNRFEAAMP